MTRLKHRALDALCASSSALTNVSLPPAMEDAKRSCEHALRQIENGVSPEAIADMLAQAAITLREATK